MESTTHTVMEGQHAHPDNSKAIWRTFWVLLAITLVEIVLAFLHLYAGFLPKFALNGIFIILTLAKAFFIVAEFMHLRHEIKNFIMTIVVPVTLFIWFIIAFLWDGDSYKKLRNEYNPKEKIMAPKTEQHVPEKGGHH